MVAGGDAAAQVLLLPFESGELSWPGSPVAILRARAGIATYQIRGALHCEQSFRPWADELERAERNVQSHIEGQFERVLLLPPRQRAESRALLARGVSMTAPGGVLVAAVANDAGARSAEADLAALVGPLRCESKRHCRVFWKAPCDQLIDQALLEEWLVADAPRPIDEGRFISRPGVFAWDRLDPASALLADCLPNDAQGAAADFGCGWGYLGAELLSRCAGITSLDCFEAEARALDLARVNLNAFAERAHLGFHWHDVANGVAGRFDLVLSNPPFHQSRAAEPALGQAFIAAAANALRPGGKLLLVANTHLPYEAVLREHFAAVQAIKVAQGFKVLEAIR